MKTVRITLILIGAFILANCNPVKSTAEADKAAAEFHSRFDAEEFETIFDDAHEDFKAAQPKSETISFLKSVRDRLGTIKSSKRTGWKANSFNLKTSVVLTFATEFENGAGVETFTYRIKDGDATLVGWYVNSNALIMTKPSEENTKKENKKSEQSTPSKTSD